MKALSPLAKRIILLCMSWLTMLLCILLRATGSVTTDITSFAVDSEGRLFVGKIGEIEVYNEGKITEIIDVHTSRGYSFVIENNVIWLDKGEYLYTLDLNDEILRKETLTDIYKWDKQEVAKNLHNKVPMGGKKVYCINGSDVYELEDALTWPRIVKNDITVYQIPFLSFAFKILEVVGYISFAISVLLMFLFLRKKT